MVYANPGGCDTVSTPQMIGATILANINTQATAVTMDGV
jgi:hypothetical protein